MGPSTSTAAMNQQQQQGGSGHLGHHISSSVEAFVHPHAAHTHTHTSSTSRPLHSSSSAGAEGSNFYRVLVNQSPQSLPGCVDGPSESCPASGLQMFLEERAAMFGGFGEICGVDYTNSTDVVGFYTDGNNGTVIWSKVLRAWIN